MALITRKNRPRVRMLNGKVNSFSRNPMVAFKNPIDDRRNQRSPEAGQLEAGNDIRHDEKRNRAEDPDQK